ncbi:alpha/beta fold hydrolase [Streptomyces gardneri]|uniref:Esterase n=1 Tax=Streptomyces gardneri TaxID=66892 RepID=A0A4Y3RL93_9ACTN|nr:alpha/beta fold hydrolase [Streptomyces gardneri]GEB57483.1 esterase [Streptomyces gardneri]GHH18083.1 esterase [Streptomyces gardneri]
MTAFVLVSGPFTRGWVWEETVRGLRAAGAEAYPVTLTGMGGRRDDAGSGTDLGTHVADLVRLVDGIATTDVVLVGHGYGLHPVLGAADRRPERVARIVALDTALPQDGEAAVRSVPDPEVRAWLADPAGPGADGGPVPPPARGGWPRWGSTEGVPAEALDRLERLAAPQPAGTLTRPLRLTGAASALPVTGVLCTGNGSSIDLVEMLVESGPPQFRALADARVCFLELATGHWPMLSAPGELAATLLRAAAGEGHRVKAPERAPEGSDERADGSAGQRTDGSADEPTDGTAGRRTDGSADEPTDGTAGPRADGSVDERAHAAEVPTHLLPFLLDPPEAPRERRGRVDLHLPDADVLGGRPRPAVVFVHGGPIAPDRRPTPRDSPLFLGYGRYAASLGVVGVTVDHRLHGLADYPRAAEDLAEAVGLVRADPRVDGDRVALWFFSTGGLLAADWLAAPPPWLRCVAANYPAFAPLPGWGGVEARFRPVDVLGPESAAVPVVLTRAGREHPAFAATVQDFLDAAAENGVEVDLVDVPLGHHGFELTDPTDASRAAVERAMRSVLRRLRA